MYFCLSSQTQKSISDDTDVVFTFVHQYTSRYGATAVTPWSLMRVKQSLYPSSRHATTSTIKVNGRATAAGITPALENGLAI